MSADVVFLKEESPLSQKIDSRSRPRPADHPREIKQNLRKLTSRRARCLGKKGKTPSRSRSRVDIPHFKHGDKQQAARQGNAESATQVGRRCRATSRARPGGDRRAAINLLDIEVSLRALAEIMGEELELPAHPAQGPTEKIVA